ncbi:hypothetical protein B0H13DRAFT_1916026 [Mycena leptocephala]|nr:hypothetical protein B0H13DRAFT_1916026 [Mycena leptocephala]
MRTVRGRKGGSADGTMDDGEAGTGAAIAGRGSHGLLQCHLGAAKRPGGQERAGAQYRPARWCAGGHPSSNRSWVGESTEGRTTLDGIFAVSTMVWNGVVIVMLSKDQEDRENTGRRQACAIASQVVIYLVLEQVPRWQEHLWEVGRVGRMGYSYCPTVRNGVGGMLPNDQEDMENAGPNTGLRDCVAGAHLLLRIGLGWQEHRLVMRGMLNEVSSMVARGRRGPLREGEY